MSSTKHVVTVPFFGMSTDERSAVAQVVGNLLKEIPGLKRGFSVGTSDTGVRVQFSVNEPHTNADYSHRNDTAFSENDCIDAVGKRASLTLTGEIVSSGVSTNGPYVKFQVDERLGFGEGYRIHLDLDLLDLEDT